MYAKIEELVGKSIAKIEPNRPLEQYPEELMFATSDGDRYTMYHSQDCCESVSLAEVVGDLEDLIGHPILQAEEVTSENATPDGVVPPKYPDSYTWTFYKLATIKGSVTLRWLGESNGYYSESVDIRKD